MSTNRKALPLENLSEIIPTVVLNLSIFPVWLVLVLPLVLMTAVVNLITSFLFAKKQMKYDTLKESNEDILKSTNYSEELVSNKSYGMTYIPLNSVLFRLSLFSYCFEICTVILSEYSSPNYGEVGTHSGVI